MRHHIRAEARLQEQGLLGLFIQLTVNREGEGGWERRWDENSGGTYLLPCQNEKWEN